MIVGIKAKIQPSNPNLATKIGECMKNVTSYVLCLLSFFALSCIFLFFFFPFSRFPSLFLFLLFSFPFLPPFPSPCTCLSFCVSLGLLRRQNQMCKTCIRRNICEEWSGKGAEFVGKPSESCIRRERKEEEGWEGEAADCSRESLGQPTGDPRAKSPQ